MEQSYSPAGMPPGNPRPKNWLVESILVTLFCCLPLGIVAIVNAAGVNSRYDAGDYNGALHASAEAGKWVKYGLYAAIAQIALGVILFMMGVGGALLSGAASN
ncbi:CD225/dispanin family protein [Hymenobacter sp. 15J16-1T3B]|uniref:CD225/dispanin family protein n=1 Tax=Hymenobacter sp. 15J16-1T3B TaxID=2886941 RepID=UPI001D0F8CFC|nr:CD225/dispanin family protein [Hymenobacter sp. 15J16-1T3B]MCC3156318.1 CD225/dispanin family protein [Hymenobacter sp. 15J16-1T3B]